MVGGIIASTPGPDWPGNYEYVLVDVDTDIATLTLNRPDAYNSLSTDVVTDLSNALSTLDAHPGIKAVVLTGGPRYFASGADIREMIGISGTDLVASNDGSRWLAITQFTKPLIAAVNGYVLGGGCELMLMCDVIIAGDSAQFGQPEVGLGIMGGAGATQRWPRIVGKHIAMEVNLMGDLMSATRARSLGVVNRVVPSEATIEVAKAVAHAIAIKPPLAVKVIKESVNRSLETSLAEGLKYERRGFQLLFGTADKAEGMSAFVEKRSPTFEGR